MGTDALVKSDFDLTVRVDETELFAPLPDTSHLAIEDLVEGLSALDTGCGVFATLRPSDAFLVGCLEEEQGIEPGLLRCLSVETCHGTRIKVVNDQLLPALAH